MIKKPGLRARGGAVQAALTAAKTNDEVVERNTPPAPSPVPSPADRAKPVGLSIRLPPELHEELRRIAFDRRVSIHTLLLEGVQAMVGKYGKD